MARTQKKVPSPPTSAMPPSPASRSDAENEEITGSRTASTMKESGLYLAIVLAGSMSRSSGKNAVERKRTTKTSGKVPWTIDALPRAQRERRADRAERERRHRHQGDHQDGPGDALLERHAEDQPDRQEPESGQEAEHAGPGEPPGDDREAGDGARQQPIGEAHLDVDGERDPRGVAAEQRRLDHRRGQQELQEAVDLGEAGNVDGAADAGALDGQQQRREDQ